MIHGVGVFALFAGMPVECTENTIDGADVGIVRIGIKDERDLQFRILFESDLISQIAKIEQLRVTKQEQTFFTVDAVIAADLIRV